MRLVENKQTWNGACDGRSRWHPEVDIGTHLKFPEITVTRLLPDIVLSTQASKQVAPIELIVQRVKNSPPSLRASEGGESPEPKKKKESTGNVAVRKSRRGARTRWKMYKSGQKQHPAGFGWRKGEWWPHQASRGEVRQSWVGEAWRAEGAVPGHWLCCPTPTDVSWACWRNTKDVGRPLENPMKPQGLTHTALCLAGRPDGSDKNRSLQTNHPTQAQEVTSAKCGGCNILIVFQTV